MNATIAYERVGGRLSACCTGTADWTWLAGAFRSIAERVNAEPPDSVVLDLRALTLNGLTTAARYRLGEAAAEVLASAPPVALVGSAQILDPERFGELVARSRGVDGRVFGEIEEAQDWLARRVAERAVQSETRGRND